MTSISYEDAQRLVAELGSVSAAAKKLGLARTTFREFLGRAGKGTSPVAHRDESALALKSEVNRLTASLHEYRKNHGQLEVLLDRVLDSLPAVIPPAPAYVPPDPGSPKSKVDACLHLTDIHFGAVQEADEVEGFGEYDPGIAETRLVHLATDVLNWVGVTRAGYDVRNLHMLMTGDYISGDIHEELRVTNAFPAPVQACECASLLARVLAMLSPEFERVFVHFVTDDNHGRLTRKPQAKEGGLNNWGYVVGRMFHKATCTLPNTSVSLVTRPWDCVVCNGRQYLLTHGHRVSGWAGFPYYGIDRLVAREALKRMNAPDIRKFHKVIMGHWHCPLAHPWYWIGGSVSGTDAYDHGQGRHSDPQQVSWMIHPRHGEFNRTEWQLRMR